MERFVWKRLLPSGELPSKRAGHAAVSFGSRVRLMAALLSCVAVGAGQSAVADGCAVSSFVGVCVWRKGLARAAFGRHLLPFRRHGDFDSEQAFRFSLWRAECSLPCCWLGDVSRADSMSWQRITPKQPTLGPKPRAYHAVARIGNSAYLFGGTEATGESSADVFVFNLGMDTCSREATGDGSASSDERSREEHRHAQLVQVCGDRRASAVAVLAHDV
jgi:hypothetical protein